MFCCLAAGLSRTAYYYEAKRLDDHDLIKALLALIERHPRWGFPKCRKRLRALGYRWNHKRIYRVYLELKLNRRRKTKLRLPAREPQPLAVPATLNTCWSMDFMADVLQHGHRFRTFNVIDDFNREVLGIDINSGMTAALASPVTWITLRLGEVIRKKSESITARSLFRLNLSRGRNVMVLRSSTFNPGAPIRMALSNGSIAHTGKTSWICICSVVLMKYAR